MQAINNSGLLTVCNVCGLTGFAPAISYVYDAGAKTILITDASVFAGGDDMKIEHVRINDADGGQMYAHIDAASGTHTFDVSGLNPVEGFTITATVVSNNHMMGDLSAYNVGSGAPATGTLNYKNKSQV